MSRKKHASLLEQLADLDDPTPKDFDPDDDVPQQDDGSDSDAAGSDDRAAAREHYVAVGKSKLRKPEEPTLGAQYAGSRVSRQAAGEEEDDDPFAREQDDDENEDSELDDAFGEESEHASEGEDEVHREVPSDEDSEDIRSDTEETSAEEEETAVPRPAAKPTDADKTGIRQAMALDRKAAATSTTNAAVEDALKGRAVKQQRATFDSLLNVRIKLQKGLIGANTISGLLRDSPATDDTDLSSTITRAEQAAFTLWSNLTALRTTLAGAKRDHDTFSADTPTATLWSHTKSQNAASRSSIDGTLSKWHAKTHTSDISARTGTKFAPTVQRTMVELLEGQMADRTRLLKRARTPRSCAPYQLGRLTAKKPRSNDTQPNGNVEGEARRREEGDETVYDDADFYSILLSTLLEQRSSSAASMGNAGSAGKGPDVTALNGYQIRREAKTRKVVDTKASKGRKLRYVVHEKLMNFCAPEDRGTWGDRQVDELFGGLLGRRVGLEEDGMDVDGEVREEEMGLLFGR